MVCSVRSRHLSRQGRHLGRPRRGVRPGDRPDHENAAARNGRQKRHGERDQQQASLSPVGVDAVVDEDGRRRLLHFAH